ncbi:MAG: class I SAM-dependent methyltransferase [Lamprobacter sp.]|uniref:class I SAM-dependent methyltransferase n=1 Tax=Lamprobacter sp. TaxID=3100796 RepID=UPI002B25ED0D|nr:class I SAM-dependent methyltransferase [Lamprobacter sp.]MEA3641129.1 class I SAM-dependent methyltransferase [Lamprobacter sp.]
MSEFNADWLQLREAADERARASPLNPALAEWNADDASHPEPRLIEILDLGAGTGANLRYLAPRLGRGQRWRCIDQNPQLLAQLTGRSADWAHRHGYQVDLDTRGLRSTGAALQLAGPDWDALAYIEQRDLATARHPENALRPEPRVHSRLLSLPAQGLITASALLDLVSADWLASLVERCRRADCALFFALSYDGRAALRPSNPADQAIIALVNRHQRGDKGFGPALGPTAAAVAETLLAAAGYGYQGARTDWQIGADEPELQRALIAGWLEAARELAPPEARAKLRAWQRERQAQIEAGVLAIQVGHRDLLAFPPGSEKKRSPRRGVHPSRRPKRLAAQKLADQKPVAKD